MWPLGEIIANVTKDRQVEPQKKKMAKKMMVVRRRRGFSKLSYPVCGNVWPLGVSFRLKTNNDHSGSKYSLQFAYKERHYLMDVRCVEVIKSLAFITFWSKWLISKFSIITLRLTNLFNNNYRIYHRSFAIFIQIVNVLTINLSIPGASFLFPKA